MSEAKHIGEFRALANNSQTPGAPSWADLSEKHAARTIVSAYTAWKLAGKPHVR